MCGDGDVRRAEVGAVSLALYSHYGGAAIVIRMSRVT